MSKELNKQVEKEEKNVVEFEERQDTKKEKEVKRVAPQYIIENKLREFLADTEVAIGSPEAIADKPGLFEITISSKNYHKITALAKTFKTKLDNVIFKFKYEDVDDDYTRTLTDAFSGNKHFDNIRTVYDAMSGLPVVITTFNDETIQYKADNRFVPDGYETTLMEDLVKDFFREDYKRSVYITKEKPAYLTANAYGGWGQGQCFAVGDSMTRRAEAGITVHPGTTIKID